MSGFQCPYCSMVMSKSYDTYAVRTPSFSSACSDGSGLQLVSPIDKSAIKVHFYRCPNCNQYSIIAEGYGSAVQDVSIKIRPISLAKKFPDYVPENIRQDYEEACAIVDLSPKASATLSRRCLQAMIRDFWNIKGKKRLVDEIDALEGKVPADQWNILNSLRRLGNIGAHPEADVNLIIDINPGDAQKLISVIELLIKQWYINRHEREQLYKDVLKLDQDTQSQRTKG